MFTGHLIFEHQSSILYRLSSLIWNVWHCRHTSNFRKLQGFSWILKCRLLESWSRNSNCIVLKQSGNREFQQGFYAHGLRTHVQKQLYQVKTDHNPKLKCLERMVAAISPEKASSLVDGQEDLLNESLSFELLFSIYPFNSINIILSKWLAYLWKQMAFRQHLLRILHLLYCDCAQCLTCRVNSKFLDWT